MKNCFTIILVALLMMSALTGCAGQNSASNTNAPVSVSKLSEPRTIPDNSFSNADYQKLLALQFNGYEDMTVSEFQNRVWKLTDTAEYRDLLERFSKSETLYALKDTNETAAFLFDVLEPLTAEKWKTRTYSGYTTSAFPYPAENSILEYSFALIILNADTLTVREYNTTRSSMVSGMQNMIKDKTKEELQNEDSMYSFIETETDNLIQDLQTEEIGIVNIEYAYFPLSSKKIDKENDRLQTIGEQEQRRYPNGTDEDYRSLLALKTPDYQNMSITDFNNALLDWSNADYERMERIGEDTARNDFQVTLTAEELSFVKLTAFLSGMENGNQIQSGYTGQEKKDPGYREYLPQKTVEEYGTAAWCSLYYQFSYHISDPRKITVGERDRCINEMINAIHKFWNNTDIETLLQMDEGNVITELQKIATACSTDNITFSTNEEQIHFERMDERAYAKLLAYKTEDYLQQSIADFNSALASRPDELTELLAMQSDVINTISPDDENYDFFTTTVQLSANALYCEHMGEPFTFYAGILKNSRPCKYLDEYGDITYDFSCFADLQVDYAINSPEILTVGERDHTLLTFKKEMQNYLDGLSEAEITDGNIRTKLADKAAELEHKLSTDTMELSCEITLIEIIDAGTNTIL